MKRGKGGIVRRKIGIRKCFPLLVLLISCGQYTLGRYLLKSSINNINLYIQPLVSLFGTKFAHDVLLSAAYRQALG